MDDYSAYLTGVTRDQSFPYVRPKDAATLILIDRSDVVPQVLLGRRHHGHEFLPGKFVFPGGRVEPADREMAATARLDPKMEEQLMRRVKRPSPILARALALAAVRETFEETGLLLGAKSANVPEVSDGPWAAFLRAGFQPDLTAIHFVARAITPPGRPRRFDTRFFAADASAIAHRISDVVGPNSELVELVWLPITEAEQLDMPAITSVMLKELEARVADGFGHDLRVPFYRMLHKRFTRELL
ncbi:MAG: NUDIX hydrolase [Bradyrhizobiaceae bacterium]|nr:NUDIX hydrolase [Bradyrhizobiaceae bacterium]